MRKGELRLFKTRMNWKIHCNKPLWVDYCSVRVSLTCETQFLPNTVSLGREIVVLDSASDSMVCSIMFSLFRKRQKLLWVWKRCMMGGEDRVTKEITLTQTVPDPSPPVYSSPPPRRMKSDPRCQGSWPPPPPPCGRSPQRTMPWGHQHLTGVNQHLRGVEGKLNIIQIYSCK